MRNVPRGQWVGNLRGENGGEYIKDTSAHTGQFFAFLCLEDTELSAITQENFDNTAAIVGVTFPQGWVIYGPTTGITLALGSVQAFNF